MPDSTKEVSPNSLLAEYGVNIRLLGVEIGDRGDEWEIVGCNDKISPSREAKIAGAKNGDLWLAWPAPRGDEAIMPKPWVNLLNKCTISAIGLVGVYIKPIAKVSNDDGH